MKENEVGRSCSMYTGDKEDIKTLVSKLKRRGEK
jgi:hypothetical protein